MEFFGGEPLLYKGIWEVVALLRSEGCELAFPTNGTLWRSMPRAGVRQPDAGMDSLDGPQAVNDAQRGQGVYDKAMRGIDAIDELKRRTGLRYPELGLTFVVTPNNYHAVETLPRLDLSRLGAVSIELQSYITTEQHRHYSRVAHQQFGVTSTPNAAAYVRSPLFFAGIDVAHLVGQMQRVRLRCEQHGVRFFSQPRTLDVDNFRAYLRADFRAMTDYHERCAVPWVYAEISARGDVTTCHSFYDVTIGNIHETACSTSGTANVHTTCAPIYAISSSMSVRPVAATTRRRPTPSEHHHDPAPNRGPHNVCQATPHRPRRTVLAPGGHGRPDIARRGLVQAQQSLQFEVPALL